MARIQVLPLPFKGDGEQPFAVVFDSLTTEQAGELVDPAASGLKEALGAKAVLAFEFQVDVA